MDGTLVGPAVYAENRSSATITWDGAFTVGRAHQQIRVMEGRHKRGARDSWCT